MERVHHLAVVEDRARHAPLNMTSPPLKRDRSRRHGRRAVRPRAAHRGEQNRATGNGVDIWHGIMEVGAEDKA